MNYPQEQPPRSEPQNLNDIHLSLGPPLKLADLNLGSSLNPGSSETTVIHNFGGDQLQLAKPSGAVERPSLREVVLPTEIRHGMVYLDTTETDMTARRARAIIDGHREKWNGYGTDQLKERQAFFDLSDRALNTTTQALRAGDVLLSYIDGTDSQLDIAKGDQRTQVGQKADAQTVYEIALNDSESKQGAEKAYYKTLDRMQDEQTKLQAKREEHEAEKLEIFKKRQAWVLLEEQHKQRAIDLIVGHTTNDIKIDVTNIDDPNGVTDQERADYQVPPDLNYRNNPSLNPLIEIHYIKGFVEDTVVPYIDKEINKIDAKTIPEQDGILRYDTQLIQEKVEEIDGLLERIRSVSGSVASSQMKVDETHRGFVTKHIALEATRQKIIEIEETRDDLLEQAERLPGPNNIPTSVMVLKGLMGQEVFASREEVFGALGLESSSPTALPSRAGWEEEGREPLAITSGRADARRGVSLAGIARQAVKRLIPRLEEDKPIGIETHN